jgi:hypothetical protein
MAERDIQSDANSVAAPLYEGVETDAAQASVETMLAATEAPEKRGDLVRTAALPEFGSEVSLEGRIWLNRLPPVRGRGKPAALALKPRGHGLLPRRPGRAPRTPVRSGFP